MLALIDTPGHEAQLTAFGKKRPGRARSTTRRRSSAQQMLKLNIFQHVVKLLRAPSAASCRRS